MTYNKEFELDLSDIDVIELCLSRELHVRSESYQELERQDDAQGMDCAKQSISEITDLLGKLHNQKAWYSCGPKKTDMPIG